MGISFDIGLSAWIIQDGNYGEFEAGREYRFALEFYPHDISLDSSSAGAPQLLSAGNCVYDAYAAIAFCSESAWVVDFGVPAYQDAKPPAWASTHARVRGHVYVGVDPFFYFESLRSIQGMPDLFRQWFIHRILLETTPWIESVDSQGRKVISRDAKRESFEEVPVTDAWKHDNGNGHYVLQCELR